MAHLLLTNVKCLLEGLVDMRRVWIFLGEVVMSEVLFHLVLDVERQPMLQEARHLPTVLTMAVTYREKVAVFETHDMW